MIGIEQIEPPVQFKPQGIGEPVIGVRLLIVPDIFSPLFTPEQNRVGTELLCRLLQARMELAGVHVTEVSRGLPFNRACFIFGVSELAPAQQAVKEELETLGLLGSAQIGWHDPREGIWRVWCSKSGRFESPSDGELADERSMWDEILSAAKKCEQLEDESSGQ